MGSLRLWDDAVGIKDSLPRDDGGGFKHAQGAVTLYRAEEFTNISVLISSFLKDNYFSWV
jgi:hypothetical protein